MGKAWRACLSPIRLSSAGAHHSDETIAAHVIAYFSMEIGLESGVPTYAGGLGALTGDTIRSAADLKAPSCCCIAKAISRSDSTRPAGTWRRPTAGRWRSSCTRCRRVLESRSMAESCNCAAGATPLINPSGNVQAAAIYPVAGLFAGCDR